MRSISSTASWAAAQCSKAATSCCAGKALESIGGFDTSIEFFGEDTDIARRVAKVGRVKWTFALPIYASGRRLKKEGIVRSALIYTINHLSILYWHKPYTPTHRDIRT